MTRAVFLWHLHQPEYRDPATGQPLLPWVRLHATRAYTDMAAALEKYDKARDLAVHFALGWMGFAARREEPLVAELVRKERGFTESEKTQLLDLSRRIAARVVPRWKKLAADGRVEITCSPLYHPILPLLVDSD